jgi:hypothetical protein
LKPSKDATGYILESNDRTPERMFALDDMDIERSTSGHPADMSGQLTLTKLPEFVGWRGKNDSMYPVFFLLISEFFNI